MFRLLFTTLRSGCLLLFGIGLLMPHGAAGGGRLQMAQVSGELLVPAVEEAAEGRKYAEEPAQLEPRPLEMVMPTYPSRALRLEQDGRVMVCFTVDETGTVREPVVVSSSDTQFNEPVLEAISASRFIPAQGEGKPVRSTACRTYRFVARQPEARR